MPGGIDADLASLVNARDLSPIVVIGALLVAVALGAAHAVSPGHGKTIMAAYLVGTRGTVRHALALGMTVTVAHTLGVLLLAVVTLGASAFVAPEALYPVLGLASGALVVAIGGSLLARRLCDVLAGRRHRHAHEHGHEHDHGHEHGHGHGHSHETLRPSRLSWRALFALGLSGGLVPSASALLLLLGSISAGRLGYGVLLVLAFGAGMAVVLGGVGLLLVHATRLIDRLPARRLSGLTSSWLQLGAAALVLVIGVALTGQALTQAF